MARLAPLLRQRYLDANGDPLVGGKVYTYVAGTSTPLATYQDADGVAQNTNPVILDSIGEATIFIGNSVYKFIVKDSNDVTQFTIDEVDGNLTTAADGVDGRTLLVGTVDPTPGDGSDGDSYFNKTTQYYYGPKASGVWPAGVLLKGDAATVAVGTVTTGAAGSSAAVSNSGTSYAAVLDFDIPQGDKGDKGDKGDTGDKGDAATVSVGTVTTGAAGSSASIANSGTSYAAVLDFTIPRGDKGDKGDTGAPGASGTAKQEFLIGTYGGVNTVFTLSQTPAAAAELIAILGSTPQEQVVDYTLSGTTVTFPGIDVSSQKLFAAYRY